MNDQLQSQLGNILSQITTGVSKAGTFVLEQLPDIAQQYVLYGRVHTAISSLFLLCLSIACLGAAHWAYKNPWNISSYSWDKDKKRSESNQLVMVFGYIFGFMFLCISIFSFDYLVWLAPKVWLLKELSTFLK